MRLRGKLNPGEHVIIATRQHYGALLPALAYLLVAIAASTFASTARSSPILWILGMICAVGAVLGAVRTAWRWATTSYLLTTHRLVVRRGVDDPNRDESLYLDSMGALGKTTRTGCLAGIRLRVCGLPRSRTTA